MFIPVQPLEGFHGLIGLGTVPAAWGFQVDGVERERHLAPIAVPDRSDGDALLHEVKVNVFLELGLETVTTRLHQFDVGEGVVVGHLFRIPPFELRLFWHLYLRDRTCLNVALDSRNLDFLTR